MAKQREKNEIELELIELLKSKAKSPKLPDAIIFSMSEGINQSLIMKLQRKAVGLPKGKEKVLNMQEDGAAFEGWAVVIRALYMSQKEQCHEKLPKWDGTITLDIADGEGVLPKYDIERGHYGRFLYRALRFYEEYGKDCGNEEWFDLSQNIKLKVKEFERFLLEADFENNIPGAEAGVNGNLENRIEAKFKDNGSLFGKIMKSQIPYISETVNRQLPCGLFRKSENEKVKEEDSIFTGGSSAIDFWNYSVNDNKENVMTIVELKADNVMIGIITEIFFYAHYCKDFFCEEPWFLKNKKEQKQFYRGYEILRNNEMKYINAVMLADKYHSLIDDEVIKVLCNCKFKKVIRYFREWYHFEISISE